MDLVFKLKHSRIFPCSNPRVNSIVAESHTTIRNICSVELYPWGFDICTNITLFQSSHFYQPTQRHLHLYWHCECDLEQRRSVWCVEQLWALYLSHRTMTSYIFLTIFFVYNFAHIYEKWFENSAQGINQAIPVKKPMNPTNIIHVSMLDRSEETFKSFMYFKYVYELDTHIDIMHSYIWKHKNISIRINRVSL